MTFDVTALPYLLPHYQAGFVRAALARGDAAPFVDRCQAASGGDVAARHCLALLRRERAGVGFLPELLAPLLLPLLSQAAKEIIKLHAQGTKGDTDAAEAYNARLAAAKKGDAKSQAAFAEANLFARAASDKGE